MLWTVKAFARSGGTTVIDDWDAPSKASAKLDQRLNFMKDRLTHEWPHDYAHKLTDAEGIWEIKFEVNNVAYRPLFFLGPGKNELTILFMAEEKGDRWRPPNALVTAIANMKAVKADHSLAEIYDDHL